MNEIDSDVIDLVEDPIYRYLAYKGMTKEQADDFIHGINIHHKKYYNNNSDFLPKTRLEEDYEEPISDSTKSLYEEKEIYFMDDYAEYELFLEYEFLTSIPPTESKIVGHDIDDQWEHVEEIILTSKRDGTPVYYKITYTNHGEYWDFDETVVGSITEVKPVTRTVTVTEYV